MSETRLSPQYVQLKIHMNETRLSLQYVQLTVKGVFEKAVDNKTQADNYHQTWVNFTKWGEVQGDTWGLTTE